MQSWESASHLCFVCVQFVCSPHVMWVASHCLKMWCVSQHQERKELLMFLAKVISLTCLQRTWDAMNHGNVLVWRGCIQCIVWYLDRDKNKPPDMQEHKYCEIHILRNTHTVRLTSVPTLTTVPCSIHTPLMGLTNHRLARPLQVLRYPV